MKSEAVRCSSCGASLDVPPTGQVVKCKFCGTTSTLSRPDPGSGGAAAVLGAGVRFAEGTKLEFSGGGVQISRDPEAREQTVEERARSHDWTVRQRTASDPYLPPELFDVLVGDSDDDVRQALAGNPALPAPVAERMAADSDYDVRCALVRNPATTGEALVRLCAEEDDSDVLKALSHRADLPEQALRALAGQPDDQARLVAARHLAAPEDLLEKLCRDRDWEVRQAAAANPRTPLVALVDLVQREHDGDVLGALHARDPLEPRLVEVLARSDVVEAREVAARAEHASPEILASLAQDDHVDVRRCVARNPQLPAGRALCALGADSDERVARIAQEHPAYEEARANALRRRIVWIGVAVGLMALLLLVALVAGGAWWAMRAGMLR